MGEPVHRFPRYGIIGLVMVVLMMAAVGCGQVPALAGFPWWQTTGWATPVCWWGYILLADAWLLRRKGASLLATRRPLLALQCILSVAFWCLFEGYNRLMPGWRYINLDPNLSVRFLGYAIAFATIMPGMFLTAKLLQSYGVFANRQFGAVQWTAKKLKLSVLLGALCCFVPPFCPAGVRGYLWAFVWIGWVPLLEPFNYWRGGPSLFRDWERGQWTRTLQLATAGAICGLLWEFWNMWAYTKWEYIFPFPLAHWLRYFEMPLVGFLGFIPFALEYFVMFHFLASFFTREDKLGL